MKQTGIIKFQAENGNGSIILNHIAQRSATKFPVVAGFLPYDVEIMPLRASFKTQEKAINWLMKKLVNPEEVEFFTR